MSKFSRIWAGCVLRGKTIVPSWICQRKFAPCQSVHTRFQHPVHGIFRLLLWKPICPDAEDRQQWKRQVLSPQKMISLSSFPHRSNFTRRLHSAIFLSPLPRMRRKNRLLQAPRATVAAGQSFLISLSLRPIPQRQKCTSLYIFALRVLPYVKTSCLLGTSGIHAASENVYPYTELHIS